MQKELLQNMVKMAQTYERLEQRAEAQGIFSAIHFALDQAGFPRGEVRAALLGFDTQPLDDRDTTPWEDDGEDQAAYQKEREDERLDAYFAPSEPY